MGVVLKTIIKRRTFIKGCAVVSVMPVFSASALVPMMIGPMAETDFNIIDYGAVADGVTVCTDAIHRAVQACHQAGGGRVVVPEGTFLTGSVELLSNVDLHVTADAALLFDAGSMEQVAAMVHASHQHNIAITGTGILDARTDGSNWWYGKGYQRGKYGLLVANTHAVEQAELLSVVRVTDCQDVLFEGVSVHNAPSWLIKPDRCDRVTMRNVTTLQRFAS